MIPLAGLSGARIRRIDAPYPDVLALSVAAPDQRGVLVFCFATAAAGVAFVRERPHGQAATSFVQKLRKELEGARILAFNNASVTSVELLLERAQLQRHLICEFAPPLIRLLDEAGHAIAQDAPPHAGKARQLQVHWPDSLDELIERGVSLLAERATSAISQQRAQLAKAIRTAQQRLERRLEALKGDIERAAGAAALRARATLLVSNQHAVRRGNTRVELLDYTLDPPASVVLELDAALSAKEQAELWFKQARRFERGAQLARERSQATHGELAALREQTLQLAAAGEDQLEQIAATARALGVRGVQLAGSETAKPRARTQRRKPFRVFVGDQQRTILVGKGAADNDELTRLHARPQDLWLHARDVSGAHVVVPLERNETCPAGLLLDAAHLAAHFSDARGAASADVSYTSKRYLRKARGSAPGAVQLEREKVIHLELEPMRLTRLLASETHD